MYFNLSINSFLNYSFLKSKYKYPKFSWYNINKLIEKTPTILRWMEFEYDIINFVQSVIFFRLLKILIDRYS